MERFRLDEKIAVITGGASGLGLSIAKGFSEAGASLVLLDLDEDKLKEAKSVLAEDGYDVQTYQVDITDEKAVMQLSEELDRVDVLVNSAGLNIRKPAINLSLEEYQHVLNVNLTGTFLMCKVFGEKMVERGSGSIINMGSIHSHVTMPNQSAYASTKGGVMQLSKVLALEFAEKGVRVNSLAPGFHHTPLADQLMEDKEKYEALLVKIPMGRFANAEEIIGPAVFLASDASSYVTGFSLVTDGGYTAQ